MMSFYSNLIHSNIDPKKYLYEAKIRAGKSNYNPDLLTFADDEKHKLMYNGVKFGANTYNDYILYQIYEKRKLIPKGTAKQKRINYRLRAIKTVERIDNKHSPSSLSYYILW